MIAMMDAYTFAVDARLEVVVAETALGQFIEDDHRTNGAHTHHLDLTDPAMRVVNAYRQLREWEERREQAIKEYEDCIRIRMVDGV